MTDKQKRFCEEYVIDWNATQAALKAGYSEKTAKSIGSENLTKPDIQSYISEYLSDLEKAAGISSLKVLVEYKKLAFSNISDLKNEWLTLKEWDELTPDQKATISEVKHTKTTTKDGFETDMIQIKLYDKLKALDAISKQLGYSTDKVEHSGEIKITVEEKRIS